MIYLLRQRNFSLLWFGGLISYIGTWISIVALPLYVYNLTGSYLATGAMWMSMMLPSVLLGSVAGVYVDRWDRRLTMVVSNLLTVPLMLILLVVQSPEQVWIVYVVTLLKSTIGNFMGPAEDALLPKLVGEEHLVKANALNTLNNNLARLVGPAIGGVVFAYMGFSYSVIMDAASFAIAGVLIALIRAPRSVLRAEIAETAEKQPRPHLWREWLEGLDQVRRNRLVSALFVFMCVAMVSEGSFQVLIIPYVKDILKGGAQELGWMMTAQAVGGLLGGLFVGRVSKRVKPVNMIGPGLFLLGLIDLAIFNLPVLSADLLLFVLAGPPVIALQTGIQTLLQVSVEDRYRGRLFGAFGTAISLSILVGQVIASLAGGATGPVPIMTLGGGIMAAMGFVALVVLARLVGESGPTAQPELHSPESELPKAS